MKAIKIIRGLLRERHYVNNHFDRNVKILRQNGIEVY